VGTFQPASMLPSFLHASPNSTVTATEARPHNSSFRFTPIHPSTGVNQSVKLPTSSSTSSSTTTTSSTSSSPPSSPSSARQWGTLLRKNAHSPLPTVHITSPPQIYPRRHVGGVLLVLGGCPARYWAAQEIMVVVQVEDTRDVEGHGMGMVCLG